MTMSQPHFNFDIIEGSIGNRVQMKSLLREGGIHDFSKFRRGRESNPRIRLLQSRALPLGYPAGRDLRP